MKKVFVTLLAILSLVGFSSCSNEKKNDAEYVLNLGDVLTEDHPHSQSYYYFADRVDELTDGKVKVNVFVNSTLGNQADLTEGLKLGTVHITKSMATLLSTYNPEIQLFDMPYLFKNKEHFFKVIDGDIGKYFLEDGLEEQDLIGLGYFYAGERSVYTKNPIESIEDMKGLKLRVPESPIYLDTMKALGATGVTMNVGELYTSMQTGVVDGAENAPIFYQQMRHYEPAPYFTETKHIITPDIVLMKKSFLESLPKKYQEAILQAAKEMCVYERKLWNEQEEETVNKLKKEGVKFSEIDITEFKNKTKSVRDKYTSIIGEDRIKEVEKIGEEF